MGCESDASRDHEDYDSEFLVGLLDAECPRDQQNRDGCEGLGTVMSVSVVSGSQCGSTLSI